MIYFHTSKTRLYLLYLLAESKPKMQNSELIPNDLYTHNFHCKLSIQHENLIETNQIDLRKMFFHSNMSTKRRSKTFVKTVKKL